MSSISAKEAELYALLEELERDYPNDIQTRREGRSTTFAGQEKDLKNLQEELSGPFTTQLTQVEMKADPKKSQKSKRMSHVDELEAIMKDLGSPPSAQEPEPEPPQPVDNEPRLSNSEKQLEELMSDLMTTAFESEQNEKSSHGAMEQDILPERPPTRLNAPPEPPEEEYEDPTPIIGTRRASELPRQAEVEINTSPFDSMPELPAPSHKGSDAPAPTKSSEDIDALLEDFDKETELYRESLASARDSVERKKSMAERARRSMQSEGAPVSRPTSTANFGSPRPTSNANFGSPRKSNANFGSPRPTSNSNARPVSPNYGNERPTSNYGSRPTSSMQRPASKNLGHALTPSTSSSPFSFPSGTPQQQARQSVVAVTDVRRQTFKPISQAMSYAFNFMGPQTTQIGCAAVYQLGAKESSGEPLQVDLGDVSGICRGPEEIRGHIVDGLKGGANIEFTINTPGEYAIAVMYKGNPLFSQKLKAFGGGGGPSSGGGGGQTVTNFKVEGLGLTFAKTGQATNFLILVSDGNGNPKDVDVKAIRVRMEGADNFFARIQSAGEAGKYLAEYSPTTPGKYVVFISFKGQNIINNIELVVT